MEAAAGISTIEDWIVALFVRMGVPTAFAVIVYGSGAWLDKMLPTEMRATVGNWMLSRQKEAFSVIDVFVKGFDQIFEVKRVGVFYLPSLIRSMAISIAVTSVVILVYLRYFAKNFSLDVRFDSVRNFLDYSFVVLQSKAAAAPINVSIAALMVAIIIINPIVDYISYVKTRSILQLFSSTSINFGTIGSLTAMAILLITDFIVASTLILVLFPLFMGVSNFVFKYISGSPAFSPFPQILIQQLLSADFFIDFFSGVGKTGLSGSFVYATYATSIWLWALFLGLAIGRVVGSLIYILAPKAGSLLSRGVVLIPFQVSAVCILLFVWVFSYFIQWDANWPTEALRYIIEVLRSILLKARGFLPW